ncbi:SLAM family member 9-like [Hemiscyllium ocellatum]|uniref:SLAM family member 9-like n=1 Tax=Hemiscyllium ocellatum TaxID=170820 RepID=UPI0029665D6D|nr:SLAM family member 9-like [Hemiscyllium ocellatum]
MEFQPESSSRFRKLYLLLYLEIQVAGLRECEGGRLPESPLVGTLGQRVMFTSTPAETLPPNVTWEIRKGDRIICNGKTGEHCFANFRGRVLLHPGNFTVELRTVQQSDEGMYQVRFQTEWKILHQEGFRLRVYEAISQPFITTTNVSINGSCAVTLTCVVQKGSHVNFTWHQQEAAVGRQPVFHHGERLDVNLSENMTLKYTCVVHNPVSVHNVTIQLHNSCQSPELMDPSEDAELMIKGGKLVTILGSVAGGCLLVLLSIFCGMISLQRLKTPDQDAELQSQSMTVYAAVSPRIPRPQTQQGVTLPTNSQSNTVYSVIIGHPSV